ncbi:hypothetical protein B1987_08755 [Mycobacterium kansasii]|uniref:Uncharacterized protein n=1 Tax=Mycobacterium attenuatum TaxID=2341086 RepID=A0A498QB80_9MYCO|nr:hypothetical protein [Mycobacterium attenuatum]ORB83877.1 hypothetical protein B1987_08755 [Mycobacterium kansasii]VBA42084.1 hypothetical protein LAUMK136_04390 [Mycobacterium attenuatum]VBA61127.1 hypothetical protein LAUMK41_04500 [Mycobacterium attenuatum]
MMGTANRSQVSTTWEQIDADEVSVLQARAAREAELVLTPHSDNERLALTAMFDFATTSNLPKLFAQPTTSILRTSAYRYGPSRVLSDLVEMLHGAILEENRHLGGAAADQYLYEDQSLFEVPDDWFAELRQTKILVDEDFELPWADG